MPGNIVVINNSKELSFCIRDSNMVALLQWLKTNGEPLEPVKPQVVPSDRLSDPDRKKGQL